MKCRIVILLAMTLGVTAVTRAQSPPSFNDVTETAGITLPDQAGSGGAWGDYDQDGWLDLYLTSGAAANVLYHNDGDGTFSISPLTASISLPDLSSSGAVFADYDNDGWPDLYVINEGGNVLFHNDGGDNFSDVTYSAGVADGADGRTAFWVDYDQDSAIDLYLLNDADEGQLYRNNGDGTFAAAALLPDSSAFQLTTAVSGAQADYDQDGRVDIVRVDSDMGCRLYHNETASGSWLTLRLIGGGPVNRDAIGAQVTVTDSDGRSHSQTVQSSSAGNGLELYFALEQAAVTAVVIHWPDGKIQQPGPMSPNQRRELTYEADPLTPISVAANVVDSDGTGAVQMIGWGTAVIAILILAYIGYRYWPGRDKRR